ncbi:MAG: NAD-dependent epimerase/dehydratase family protein [Eubacterium sp.]|jgi:nucleoside-diphosphate-sugar epimerase|nr:NAD-dependent epimerase/dehydratase family protein [Eubacterium sp.]
MKVLVIGGTGNISSAIVDRLCEQGHETTVFNRGLRPVRYKGKVNAIYGDKNSAEDFFSKMKGLEFDAVIDMISYYPDNANLTLEAFKYNDPHFIFTSTVAAYKRPFAPGNVPVVETNPLCDKEDVFPYGYHKARMEDFLWKKSAEGIKITVIRPSLTYGIGCKNIGVFRNNYGIVERIKQKKPLIMFGDGTNPWAWTFAPDIAKAYAGALRREACYGQAYHATSDDVRPWDDLYIEFGKIIGIEPKILHMSTEMISFAAPEQILHVFQEKMHAGIFDNSKIKRDIPEFKFEYTLDKIIKDIYEWYLSDPQARVTDDNIDRLEDELVYKYYKCEKILKE